MGFLFFATDSSKESFFKGKLGKMMGAEGTFEVVEAGGCLGVNTHTFSFLLPTVHQPLFHEVLSH